MSSAAVDRRRERGDPQGARIDAEEDVVHRRVPDHRDLEDIGGGKSGRRGHGADEAIQAVDDCAPELLQAVGVVHCIGDPRDHILAVGDLGVHERLGSDDRARSETAEITGDGGRSHVDGQAVGFLHLTGKDGEDFLLQPEGRGYAPVPLSQGAGKLPQGGVVDRGTGEVVPFLESGNEAVVISLRIGQIGGDERYGEQADGGIQGDCPVRCLFSHHLRAPAALLRHEQHDIPAYFGGAGQAEPLRPLLIRDEPGLLVGEGRKMGGVRSRLAPDKALAAALFPPQRDSMPTPSERAASRTVHPSGTPPRLPEG